jgi:hypothetical protein
MLKDKNMMPWDIILPGRRWIPENFLFSFSFLQLTVKNIKKGG